MTKPAITRLSALEVAPSSTNNENGLGAPQLTAAQRDAIPNPENGYIIYNTSTNQLNIYINGAWTVSAGGSGNVTGPAVSVQNDIAIFANNTGQTLADSGIAISSSPNPNPTNFSILIPGSTTFPTSAGSNNGVFAVYNSLPVFASDDIFTGTIPTLGVGTCGRATITAGNVTTVASNAVTTRSIIIVSRVATAYGTPSTNAGPIEVTDRTVGANFTVTSYGPMNDDGSFFWIIFNPQ